jgi:hypothetical protein
MKTKEQIDAYLEALHKDVLRMYSEGVMSVERQKAFAQIVGTLLWANDDPISGNTPEVYIADVLAQFNGHFGGAEKPGKYGAIFSTQKKFHRDEPVFLIRATDPLAYKIVQEYGERCVVAGCSTEHVEAAFAHAKRIREWQERNPSLVKKLPD